MTLSYRTIGSGTPLLLVHGMGVTYSIWENLIPQLSPYYKLIMVELLGHGSSEAAPQTGSYYLANAGALEALRCELGIERWDILGYSIGAWVVQAYSAGYPEHVGKIALVCPAVLSRPGSAALRGLTHIDRVAPSLTNWLLRDWRLHTLVRLLGFGGRNHPYARVWTREIGAHPPGLIKRLLKDLPGGGRAELRLPTTPVLMLWARQDVVSVCPHPPQPTDRSIPGQHSAPLLSAGEIAAEVLLFFKSRGIQYRKG